MDGGERAAGEAEGVRVCARVCELLPEGHERQEADQADEDDGALHDAEGDVAVFAPVFADDA